MEQSVLRVDIAVVGAGLLGSAAARHLTCMHGGRKSIALVGPIEGSPRTPHQNSERSVFCCHMDEGRVTRALDPDVVWSKLAARSMERYKKVEHDGDHEFYHPVGFLALGRRSGEYIQKMEASLASTQLEKHQQQQQLQQHTPVVVRRLDGTDAIQREFPFLSLAHISGDDALALFEPGGGWVSARGQVKAQQEAAKKARCTHIVDLVMNITEITEDGKNSGQAENKSISSRSALITTATGRQILASKVLLATASQTNFRELLPSDKKLDLELLTQTIVFLELNEHDAKRLAKMPSIICEGTDGDKFDAYILPPIRYPDGKCYLKLGHGEQFEKQLHSQTQLERWYRSHGDSEAVAWLQRYIHRLIPGLSPLSVHSDACVTTHTPTNQLYIDMISSHIGVLVGDNGYSAKSADEIGRMGAAMISETTGDWAGDIPAHTLRAKYAPPRTAAL
eukprot:TRINITY_DN5752_c0_g1_i1.p1 TRINITY_DN5752_c0_g1~~TRINITY_DN5752_c0_g1_i1.p1  ORF type:complete len:464 (+),score=82.30 TRINITY_DN5752_c0_g1_i1:40-1392(+)